MPTINNDKFLLTGPENTLYHLIEILFRTTQNFMHVWKNDPVCNMSIVPVSALMISNIKRKGYLLVKFATRIEKKMLKF